MPTPAVTTNKFCLYQLVRILSGPYVGYCADYLRAVPGTGMVEIRAFKGGNGSRVGQIIPPRLAYSFTVVTVAACDVEPLFKNYAPLPA